LEEPALEEPALEDPALEDPALEEALGLIVRLSFFGGASGVDRSLKDGLFSVGPE